MASTKTRGRCLRCEKEFAHAGMGKHLAACLGAGPALLVTMDVGPGTWWMHLAVAPAATLQDLDNFLRDTWLECCGHLSAFEIGKTRFESHTGGGGLRWGPKPLSMAAKCSAVLHAGMTFSHEYDFGSTTTLRGRVLGGIEAGPGKITLLAQNEEVIWPCDGCGEAANLVCPHCYAMTCGPCETSCSCLDSFEDEALPVVNSPRMGVCGYTG